MKRYIIGIDEGTTSERVVLFDTKINKIIDFDSNNLKQYFPNNGWVEHDAEEIWEKVEKSLTTIIKRNKLKKEDIYCIGITNQRETTIAFDKTTGKPICKAIVWQCRRTAEYCSNLSEKDKTFIQSKTGLIVDSYFSASKMRWIMQNVKNAKILAKNGNLGLCTVDAFLIFKLTGGKVYATDTTNASRTMLTDLSAPQIFDKTLLNFFEIPESCMAEIKNTTDNYGYANTIIGEIPICSVVGDQQGSLFGQGCFKKGEAKVTYGTGAFVLINLGKTIPSSINKMINTVAWTIKGKTTYAVEGSVFNVGSTLNFLKTNLGLFKSYAEIDPLCMSLPSNQGVYFIPAFTGLGAPYWDSSARGKICGLTLSNNRANIIRSAIESFCYSVYDILDYLIQNGNKIKELRVDGGVSKSVFLMQFQSNLLQIPVSKTLNNESTVLGAIYLAGLGSLAYENIEEIQSLIENENTIIPNCSKKSMEPLIDDWHYFINQK